MRYNELWRMLVQKGYPDGEAKAVVRTLLTDKYGMSMADMLCCDVDEYADADSLAADVARLMAYCPVQYVVGKAWFCDRQFAVRPGCLIPRPETEELCQWIITDYLQHKPLDDDNAKPSILDIGTGSGCIAVTLSLDISGAVVDAWDISDDAIAIARDNVRTLGANVNVLKCDALNPPSDVDKYDIIVSNPPYICQRESRDMSANVMQYEPHTALFVPDDNALLFYRGIASYASSALKHGGTLYFEINPLYAEDMRNMLINEHLSDPEIRTDQYEKQRFIKSTRI